eukprot:COSAG01_NODE_6913_length_3441_cov_8.635357_6_plen_113_part_00
MHQLCSRHRSLLPLPVPLLPLLWLVPLQQRRVIHRAALAEPSPYARAELKLPRRDHNHVLDREEFKEALAIWDMTGLNEAEINVLMAHFDDDGDGMITYPEFLHGATSIVPR